MRLLGFLPVAFLGAVLAMGEPSVVQVALGQDSGAQQDNTGDQAPPDMTPPDQVPSDQPPAEQAPSDQAPSPAADDAHWWLKRGGSADFGIAFVLKNDYRQFWQFRTQALAQLDTIFLPEVMEGVALAKEEAALHQFQSQGKAQIVVVENNPQIWYATLDEAVIYDPYVSRSYFVDAKTRAPLGDGPNTAPTTASMAYHLTKHPEHFGDLVWKVDDIVVINFQ